MITEQHRRPADVDDATVRATGKLSEAVECIERARGVLYDFHQSAATPICSSPMLSTLLDEAGHHGWAECVRDELLGRDVIPGRWTFQIVEDYDATYWECARSIRSRLEADLMQGRTHVHEAEMKQRRRTDA